MGGQVRRVRQPPPHQAAGPALPLQRIEAIDEPRDREKALIQSGLFDDAAWGHKARRDNFRNMLVWGDHKLALATAPHPLLHGTHSGAFVHAVIEVTI